jgi:Zn finger protein HypA/HybF involved in hydrogenase expression
MQLTQREKKTLTVRIEKFIRLGQEKHGEDTYDYTLVPNEYKNNRTPVHIKCTKCDNPPFKVYPFAHTDKGDNQKGTCPHCYVPKQTVQETRWDPNLPERVKEFTKQVEKKYPKGMYSYPFLREEYKNEESKITVVCNHCDSKPYKRKARSLKSKSRKGGCPVCTKEERAKVISEKNRNRQLRNHETQHVKRPQGWIYKITNAIDAKFYIGYTVMGIEKRLKAHKDEAIKASRGNSKAKSYLHSAMNYHGLENFSVETVAKFQNVSPAMLSKIEIQYIAKMNPQYNVSPGGELGHYKVDLIEVV